jgi:PAS domain-containing protein
VTENIPRQSADRRQLQQIIAGLTEGIILIDPDRSIVWANETALAIHGASTLAELGAMVEDYCKIFTLRYRNNHVLAPEQYPMERVLQGELFHDVIVEVTRATKEDVKWVHQVRSLILSDASDRLESLVLVLRDMTERFSAEERFERTFNANPAPAIICRLSDLRYVKVNHGFLEMTGYAREDVIGSSTYEIDVLEQAERKDAPFPRWRRCSNCRAAVRSSSSSLVNRSRSATRTACFSPSWTWSRARRRRTLCVRARSDSPRRFVSRPCR